MANQPVNAHHLMAMMGMGIYGDEDDYGDLGYDSDPDDYGGYF